MNQIFIKLLFLIFIIRNADANDELFGDKSIIRKLRNELGSFKTEIEFIDKNKKTLITEQYDFKSKNGKLQHSVRGYYETLGWFDDFKKHYKSDSVLCSLKTGIFDSEIETNLMIWSVISTIKIPSKFKMLGPSHLLFFIIDSYDENKENIKCQTLKKDKTIRCDAIFDKTQKVEYYFKDDNQFKMYPIKIKSFIKQSDQMKLITQINYDKFDYSINGDDYRINSNLPIGEGCWENKKYDPKIEINLGEQFEIEYDAELDYLDLERKDKDIYLKTQFKSQKLFTDTNFSFSILDRIDEETNKNIRTYFDTDTKLAYDVYDDKCIKHNFKDGFKQNLISQIYNVRSMNNYFLNNIFEVFSYLGDYKFDQIYRLFEKKQYIFMPEKELKKNEDTIPGHNFVTHYYSKSNKKIPKLIEVRIKSINNKLLGLLKIKIYKHNSVSLSSYDFNVKINLDQCFRNLKSTDYKELDVTFEGDLKQFNDDYIKYEFRKLISRNDFSPLRIHDIKLEKKSNQIKMMTKLIEPLDLDDYFEKVDDLTIDESEKTNDGIAKIIKSINNEILCSRLCIKDKNCASYSFNEQVKICKLWIDKKFNGDIDSYGYDWKRVKKNQEKDSKLFKRLIRFYRSEHISSDYTLNSIKKLIKEKKFYFVLKINRKDKGKKIGYFGESNSDNGLLKFAIYSIVVVLIIAVISSLAVIKLKKNKNNHLNRLESL